MSSKIVERSEVELLRRLHAVHLGHHAVAADAANVEAVEPEAGDIVLDVDAGLVLDEVGEVPDQAFLHRLAVDDRDRAGRAGAPATASDKARPSPAMMGEGAVRVMTPPLRVRTGVA